jgi:hypothetical protein
MNRQDRPIIVRRHPRSERTSSGIARGLFGIVIVLGLAACTPRDGTRVIGAWSGRDSVGTVFYRFGPDGHGYRIVHGQSERFRYEVDEGYLNLIRIRAVQDEETEWRTGLVQVAGRKLRLELGEPGGNGPRQISQRALVLFTPPTHSLPR